MMYIINFDDNEGFALVSADKRTTSILAIIDEGSMTTDMLTNTENTAFNILIWQTIVMQLYEISTYKKSATTYAHIDPSQVTNYTAPKLKTKWAQGHPYNLQSPLKTDGTNGRMPAGCAPVAMAQAVSFFQTKNSVTWSDIHGSGSSDLNWSQIIIDCENWHWCVANTYWDWEGVGNKDYSKPNQYGYGRVGEGLETTNQVAHLIRSMGAAITASYGNNSTSGNTVKALNHLSDSWGINKDDININSNITNIIKQSNYLIWISATNISEGGGSHGWLIDGGFTKSGINYVHCNFGWDGYCDGYYIINEYNLIDGPKYTNIAELGGGRLMNYASNISYTTLNK